MYPTQAKLLVYNQDNEPSVLKFIVLFEDEYQFGCIKKKLIQRILDQKFSGLKLYRFTRESFEYITDWNKVKGLPIVDFT